MLFSRERAIIFIDKEKISWVKGKVPTGKFLGVVQEAICSEENLQLVLVDIAKNFPQKARISVGEEFSYVVRFQKEDKKVSILSEAQALIPESLEEGWDSKEGDADDVQVMAVQKQVFAALKKALLENKIEVEAIETESVSISRLVPAEKDKTVLIARFDGKILLEVVRNGLILATRIFFQLPEKEKVQEFLDYASSRKNINFDAVFVQDETGKLLKIFQELGLNVQNLMLDPMVGICQKRDISGRDQDVLNIILGKEIKKTEPARNATHSVAGGEKERSTSRTLREKILLVAFLIIFLGGMMASYFIYQSRQNVTKISPQKAGISKDPKEVSGSN